MFRKAKAEQAALKVGIYGPPGSGKTFTTLLIAEGLAKAEGKRIAYVDSEHGTDFYCQSVPTRRVHPEAFEFDALYTRSISEATKAIRGLDPAEHGVVVIDSITHFWEAARAAYSGRTTSAGTIPMQAWGRIKKPYKDLMAYLLSSPMHVFILGRQGIDYETDEETEELRAVGYKMKAEGETPYEPHILIRLEAVKPRKTMAEAVIYAQVEKDRTGVLQGRSIEWPNFDSIARPLLGLLGKTQASVLSGDEAAAIDAEAFEQDQKARETESAQILRTYSAKLDLAENEKAVKEIGKSITPAVKARMTTADVALLRQAYLDAEDRVLRGPGRPLEGGE